MIREKNRQAGNAMLELVLFLPLFLLFLFIAVDGGLAFSEKAAMADGLRAGLNMERFCAQGKSILSVGQDFSVQADTAEASAVSQCLVEEISKTVNRNLGLEEQSAAETYRVVVSAYEVFIDPNLGAAISYSPLVSVSNPENGGSAELPGANPEYDYVSEQEFVASRIALGGSEPSAYALPLSYIHSAQSGDGSLRFLERSIVLYAEITAFAQGTNTTFVKNILGKYYAVEEQQLLLLRTQLA